MRWIASLAAAAFALGLPAPAFAQSETIKIGIIGPFSGPFSKSGREWAPVMTAFQQTHADLVKGRKVEIVIRDLPEPNPGAAKALAQELVIKEKVQYLGGLFFTPDALAVGQVAQEAKIPTVIFNAATSSILEKSSYLLRTSYTLPQVSVPIARYALDKGMKRIVTMVADYAPGADSEAAFTAVFTQGGGEVPRKIRVPLKANDFGPFMQTVLADKPDAVYAFTAGGQATYAILKAFEENGLKAAGIRFLGTAETMESDLPMLGDSALGVETALHYSPEHPSPQNKAFLDAVKASSPDTIVTVNGVAAWDGLHLIYHMIEATGGKADGAAALAAAKGYAWESPRGPVKVDAATRQLIQNVYTRIVEKDASGKLVNTEIATWPAQAAEAPPAK